MKPRFSKAINEYVNTDDPEEREKKVEGIIKEFKNISGEDEDQEKLARKKNILICHSSKDKSYADFVFHLLIKLGLTADEIIYSSAKDTDDERSARLPIDGFMTYLKKFFIQHIYENPAIVLIHSCNLKTWNPTIEVGASWVSGSSSRIIQIVKYNEKNEIIKPEEINPPLHKNDLYLELEIKKDTSGKNNFTFNDRSMASQWFRKLINRCHDLEKLRGQRKNEFSWNEHEFHNACKVVNEKIYRKKG